MNKLDYGYKNNRIQIMEQLIKAHFPNIANLTITEDPENDYILNIGADNPDNLSAEEFQSQMNNIINSYSAFKQH